VGKLNVGIIKPNSQTNAKSFCSPKKRKGSVNMFMRTVIKKYGYENKHYMIPFNQEEDSDRALRCYHSCLLYSLEKEM
jgi:hypothetical protein